MTDSREAAMQGMIEGLQASARFWQDKAGNLSERLAQLERLVNDLRENAHKNEEATYAQVARLVNEREALEARIKVSQEQEPVCVVITAVAKDGTAIVVDRKFPWRISEGSKLYAAPIAGEKK